ncbi:MAG: hypothetical protein ACE37K_09765 [Planctomycetota bacterium]
MRWLSLALLWLLAGCAGIFQRAAPDRVETYLAKADASTLRVGSAARDVTPAVGDYLGGFDLARTSTGIGSPLEVRVLVFETATRRFAIVGIDSLGLMREDVDYIKSGMAGFANGDVFVCSSHTHAGPDPIGIWGYYFLTSGRDGRYIGRLRKAVREATAEARANAAPAVLRQGVSLLPEQGLVRNSNRSGVFDRRVRVLHAQAVDDGRPLGTLLHMACHPEVLRRKNTLVSADFVGALCDEWQRRGHGQAVFANGALGAMITPQFRPNDMTGVAEFGRRICALCERALEDGEALPVDAIEVRRSDLYLPMISAAFRIGRATTSLQRELFDGAARTSVGYLRIGAFEAVAVPGEMEPALAQQVRGELGRPDLVVLGLCDDEVGYLMREQEAVDPEFAYERSMSPCRMAGEMVRRALTGR